VKRLTLIALCLLAPLALAAAAGAEQSSSSSLAREAGLLDAGGNQACAVVRGGALRCWGLGAFGVLGYGNQNNIGDDEPPSSAGPVAVGAGRTVRAVTTGGSSEFAHTCAILDDGSARCWGGNSLGQLGLNRPAGDGPVGDDELPSSVPPVDIGGKALAITAGGSHVCAIREGGSVLCWGNAASGQLGYGNKDTIGDNETPASAGSVDIGAGRTARAIVAGGSHTCTILDTGAVVCWGFGADGELGYGNTDTIGDNETPASAGTVKLGQGRTAVAIAAGNQFTCALLDDGSVRCWGKSAQGSLGYGNTDSIGDNETPDTAGPVNLGAGRTARAITAGFETACVILDTGDVRCWGTNGSGQLGYGQGTNPIGNTPATTPDKAGPVNLGAGRTAHALTIATATTCALLDDGSVRCWGAGQQGELGSASKVDIGDNETADKGPLAALGAPLITSIGDASLSLSVDHASAQVGERVRLTATLSSLGPDSVFGALVKVTLPAGLAPVAGGASTLSVPRLDTGQAATLQVLARVTAPGRQTASAELADSAAFFSDSSGTNDRAAATITGTRNAAPAISGLSMRRRSFAVAAARTPLAASRRGSEFLFRLSERSTVAIRIERVLRSRTAGKRYVRVGDLTRAALAAGKRRIAFSGRIGRRALAPGSYRATLVPTDSLGLRGAPRRVSFAVRRR
jgi:alpha-tubulin suppressor-like RCC1 family protein